MNKRVVLTNKKTGQSLPEADLISDRIATVGAVFDGSSVSHTFMKSEWDVRYVRPLPTVLGSIVTVPADNPSALPQVVRLGHVGWRMLDKTSSSGYTIWFTPDELSAMHWTEWKPVTE